MLDKPNSMAVRKSANHGFLAAVAAAVSAVFGGGIALDALRVPSSFSIVPSGKPTEFAVTPRFASIFALATSILPINLAEPVNCRGIPAVSCWRSGAVPEISRLAGVRLKSSTTEGNSSVPRR